MKKNRGWMSYIVVLGIFILIAVLINSGMMQEDRTLTYTELWDKIEAGEVIATLYSSSEERLDDGEAQYLAALTISDEAPDELPLIHKIIRKL